MENLCRTCLRSPQNLLILFDDPQLPHKIEVISSVQVSMDDHLPTRICEECIKNINTLYNFRKVIINSNLELQQRYEILQRETLGSLKQSDDENDGANVSDPDDDNMSEPIIFQVVDEPVTLDSNPKDLETIAKQVVQDIRRRKKYSLKNMMMYNKRSYRCHYCNFFCTEYSKWQNHKRTHHYAPGVCNICGKSIRTDNLQKHIKSHSETPMPCTECGKIFKNSESLRTHRIIHFGEDLCCKLCAKVYKYRGEYNRHMKHHLSQEVKKVKCSLCDKMFRNAYGLKRHLQSHTGERPYVCSHCKKGFSSPYSLKTHIRQHTKERPYICEYCSMGFPQKVSLVSHIKAKHSTTANEDDVPIE